LAVVRHHDGLRVAANRKRRAVAANSSDERSDWQRLDRKILGASRIGALRTGLDARIDVDLVRRRERQTIAAPHLNACAGPGPRVNTHDRALLRLLGLALRLPECLVGQYGLRLHRS